MEKRIKTPDYKLSQSVMVDHIVAFVAGFAAGFAVLFIFYNLTVLSVAGGAVLGAVNIFVSMRACIEKRLVKLRIQFFDLLEAMSVAMRAGHPMLRSLQSSKEDLLLIYPENSDIIVELDIIIGKFNNAVPLSESFSDLANRSGLEDIASFASIYATMLHK